MSRLTSTTLLRDIASSAEHARWSEFVSRYRPMMEAFLAEHFPFLPADDAIQETLLALVKALPSYRYDPDSTGFFRNYLTGVLVQKAVDICRRNSRYDALKLEWRKRCDEAMLMAPKKEDVRKVVLEIAMRQLMLEDSIHDRTKMIFHKVAVEGCSPEEVASAYGVTRNAVDQIKDRMIRKLRAMVEGLEASNGR